jgi:hypothetical protein
LGAGGSPAFAWQSRQRVTLRISQTMQMNVPQPAQGYPSEARSAAPQDRHSIMSPCWTGAVMPGN